MSDAIASPPDTLIEQEEHKKRKMLTRIGQLLLFLGIFFFATLLIVVLVKHGVYHNSGSTPGGHFNQISGTLAALGFLSIMISMAFIFPELLKGGPNENMSTMRVAVYMIICVFVFLTVKIGWSCSSFAEFNISNSWVSIIIAALGGKAVQSLAENNVYAKRSANQAKDGDSKTQGDAKDKKGTETTKEKE